MLKSKKLKRWAINLCPILIASLLFVFNLTSAVIGADAAFPWGDGSSSSSNAILSQRLKTRNDGGRITIPIETEAYSAKTDAGYFQSETEDTTWGYDKGRRDQMRIKTSADIWWNTNDSPYWHFLDADDTPAWFVNEQMTDIKFRAADAGSTEVFTVTAIADTGVQSIQTFTFGLPEEFEVDTATFSAVSASTDGDALVVYDTNGNGWGIYLDVSGSSEEPTWSVYTSLSSSRKTSVDVSAWVTAAEVADVVKDGFDSLSGFTTVISASDAGSDGSLVFTAVNGGWVENDAVVRNLADDDTAFSIAIAQTTEGFTDDGDYVTFYDPDGNKYALGLDADGDGAGHALGAPTVSGYAQVSGSRKVLCDISDSSAANQTAALVEICLETIPSWSSIFNLDDTATDGTMTLTAVKAGPVSAAVAFPNTGDTGTSGLDIAEDTPGVASNYEGTYFTVTSQDSTGYEHLFIYWFSVEGNGSQPNVSDAGSYYEVTIGNYADDGTAIAVDLEATDAANTNLSSSNSSNVWTVTHGLSGQQTDPSDGTSPVTTAVTANGASAAEVTIDLDLY